MKYIFCFAFIKAFDSKQIQCKYSYTFTCLCFSWLWGHGGLCHDLLACWFCLGLQGSRPFVSLLGNTFSIVMLSWSHSACCHKASWADHLFCVCLVFSHEFLSSSSVELLLWSLFQFSFFNSWSACAAKVIMSCGEMCCSMGCKHYANEVRSWLVNLETRL